MHPTLCCTVLLAWGALERGCGCRLSREHSQEQTAKSSFSSQQRDAMGDRNLPDPEIGGRQMSGICFLQRWDLPREGAKVFWQIVCRVSQIPKHHSGLSLLFVRQGTQWSSGSAASSLKAARPWIQSVYSILTSGKTVILLWKWWDFPDLFSSTAMRTWRLGRGREEGDPELLPLKQLNKAAQ